MRITGLRGDAAERLMPLIVLGAIVLLAVGTTHMHAQTPTTVVGRITDVDTKEVLSSVQVKIGNAKEVRTDREGRFRIDGAPSGVQTVQLRRVGYRAEKFERNFTGGADTVAFTMLMSSKGEEYVWCPDGSDQRVAPDGSRLGEHGIRIVVRDAQTKVALTDVEIIARGRVVDTLRLDSTTYRMPTFAGVFVAGEYIVTVSAPGYQPGPMMRIRPATGCNTTYLKWHEVFVLPMRRRE